MIAADPAARRRRSRFPLTPLVDVIFLLLIFFMLSSRLAPYSLVPLDTGGRAPTQSEETIPAAGEAAADLLVILSRGAAQIGSERVRLEEARPLFAEAHERGARSVIVLTRASATVQDVVSALDWLRRAGFSSIAVQSPRGEGP